MSPPGCPDGLFLSWLNLSTDPASRKQLYPLCTSLLKTCEQASQSLTPEASMAIRVYAVRCVLIVSSPEDATWVWKQVRNIAASWVKTLSLGFLHGFTRLHTSLIACIDCARFRNDRSLFKDPSFEALCQQWIKIAMKAGDQRAVDYVERLLLETTQTLTQSVGSIQHALQKLSAHSIAIEEAVTDRNGECTLC